ncbi:MAG: hypothetical protein HY602_02470 [Parcubacteria group bacterium]|nr:hypothetical protein [Parcubacteria group bacterium]
MAEEKLEVSEGTVELVVGQLLNLLRPLPPENRQECVKAALSLLVKEDAEDGSGITSPDEIKIELGADDNIVRFHQKKQQDDVEHLPDVMYF